MTRAGRQLTLGGGGTAQGIHPFATPPWR
jgi:hypothetical protein